MSADRTACGFELSRVLVETLGVSTAVDLTIHELDRHQGAECVDARAHLVAFVVHMLKLAPDDLRLVREELERHLDHCDCRTKGSGS